MIETIYRILLKIEYDELHENIELHQIFHHLMKYPVEDLVKMKIKMIFYNVSLSESS